MANNNSMRKRAEVSRLIRKARRVREGKTKETLTAEEMKFMDSFPGQTFRPDGKRSRNRSAKQNYMVGNSAPKRSHNKEALVTAAVLGAALNS